MITAFALLLDRCGLSHREAAAYLDVRLDTVRSWSSGRERVRAGAIAELRTLYARIERAAAEALAVIEERGAGIDAIDLLLASDDAAAQRRGWCCVGAQAAMLGLVTARAARPVRVVSDRQTAAASGSLTDL